MYVKQLSVELVRLLSRHGHYHHAKECIVYRSKSCRRWSSSDSGQQQRGIQPLPEFEAELIPIRKVKREPFVKNLFLGKFDTDILTFPEVLDRNRCQTLLDETVAPIEAFFKQNVDGSAIDTEGKISEDLLNSLKQLGLFGQEIPIEYGGLGLNTTEYARLSEVIGLDSSIAITLTAHQALGLKGILIAGTEEQKQKYLPKLASGEHIAALCLAEASSGSDLRAMKTQATLSEDGTKYLLSGTKTYVTNGSLAEVYTVFAQTKVQERNRNVEKITAFIVERGYGNVSVEEPYDKLGVRGSNTTTVRFDNTPVPVENVIGEVGHGFLLALNIINNAGFSLGSESAGWLRYLLDLVVEHAIEQTRLEKPLKDYELIQQKVAKISMAIYAMESMSYLTAGLIDSQDDPDCSVEAAILKVFSSEASWDCINHLFQIMGGLSYTKSQPFERYLRDCRLSLIFQQPNEILRMFIATVGCQYAGVHISDFVRKIRNPLQNPAFIFREAWKRRLQLTDKPKLDLDLKGHLHPSLLDCANSLEYCVKRLQFAVEAAFTHHGKNLLERQLELNRLADVAIDIYAITACLGRASRAYCIGLRHSDQEMQLANLFTLVARLRVKQNVDVIIEDDHLKDDIHYKRIADVIFKNKGYCFQHPLTRNF